MSQSENPLPLGRPWPPYYKVPQMGTPALNPKTEPVMES